MALPHHEHLLSKSETQAPMPDSVGRAATKRACLTAVVPAWVLGVAAVVFVRYRGKWDAYLAVHRWCAEHGISASVRHLDSLFLYAAAALLGSLIASRALGGTVMGRLLLQKGRARWGRMVLVALLPMVAGGAVLGGIRNGIPNELGAFWQGVIGGVVRAPVSEELLFRGLLVGVSAAALGWSGLRFWCNAAAAAMVFASVHVEWKAGAIESGWPTLLVTGAGGLWYAWLLSRWQSLWVPMALHAGMNLGWMLAGTAGGAGGGGWIENLLRVGTIGVATWLTIRMTRAPTTMRDAGIG